MNRLERLLPEGLLADSAWMNSHDYSTSLRSQYVTAGWLKHPAGLVYRRGQSPLTWQQVVVSLQTLLEKDLIIGGRSALQLQGFAHFVPMAETSRVYLYGPQSPPRWLDKLPLGIEFAYRNSQRLFAHPAGVTKTLPPDASTPQSGFREHTREGGLASQSWEGSSLVHSSAERALLELLGELPNGDSFHEVDMVVEGLANLSPRRLENLLLDCRSVKVKRLFFFFADRHQHAWLKHINRSLIGIGKGKRMIVRGGRFDTAHQITVPEDL